MRKRRTHHRALRTLPDPPFCIPNGSRTLHFAPQAEPFPSILHPKMLPSPRFSTPKWPDANF